MKFYDVTIYIKGMGYDIYDVYRINAENALQAVEVCRDRISEEISEQAAELMVIVRVDIVWG